MFDLTNGTYSRSGITAVVSNGGITLNGTATANAFVDIPVTHNYTLEENETYTIATNNPVASGSGAVRFRVNNNGTLDTYCSIASATNTFVYNLSDGFTNQVTIRVASGTTLTNFFLKPMLVKGSTIGNYEPYGSGIWYKKEYIGKHILSTSDTWALNRNSNNLYQYRTKNDLLEDVITSPDPYSRPVALCNYYTKGDINGMTTQCFNIGGLKYIGITSDISTLANFNTFITNNSIYVYYVCQTPNDIEITNSSLIEQLDNLEKLKSYNGTTNISSSGSLPMILNVSAIKGES